MMARTSRRGLLRCRAWILVTALVILAALLTARTDGKATTRSGSDRNDPRRIRMDSLTTLYFKDGMQTWTRRDKRYPQLQCVGNSKHICNTYAPDIVVCKHTGDGSWRCEADLHRSVRMGAVDVSCEGWDGPDDNYIMRGSCLLKYNLLPAYRDPSGSDLHYDKDRNSLVLVFIIAVFLAILWYNNRRAATRPGPGPRNSGGGGGGGGPGWFGGGWGGGWGGGPGHAPQDPPPPYRPYPKTEAGSSGTNNSAQQQQEGWRPGFWSGLGAGALAAEAARYMRSGGNGPQRYAGPARATYAAPGRNRPFFGDNNDDDSFGGFGGGSGGRNGFGSASSSGSRGDTHRSMGFGGSSVR